MQGCLFEQLRFSIDGQSAMGFHSYIEFLSSQEPQRSKLLKEKESLKCGSGVCKESRLFKSLTHRKEWKLAMGATYLKSESFKIKNHLIYRVFQNFTLISIGPTIQYGKHDNEHA